MFLTHKQKVSWAVNWTRPSDEIMLLPIQIEFNNNLFGVFLCSIFLQNLTFCFVKCIVTCQQAFQRHQSVCWRHGRLWISITSYSWWARFSLFVGDFSANISMVNMPRERWKCHISNKEILKIFMHICPMIPLSSTKTHILSGKRLFTQNHLHNSNFFVAQNDRIQIVKKTFYKPADIFCNLH